MALSLWPYFAGQSVNWAQSTAPYSASFFLPSWTMAFFSSFRAAKPHQPACGHGKGKDPVFIGFHHLGEEIVIGRSHLLVGVPVFHFHIGIGHGFAFEFDHPLEDVAGIETEGPGQGDDFGLEAHFLVPVLFFPKGGDIGLGLVDDEFIFRRFPVGRRDRNRRRTHPAFFTA